MRLLIASSYFDTHLGGVEMVAGRLARELAITGHAVELAAANSSETPADNSLTLCPLRSSNFLEKGVGLPLPILTPKAIVHLHARCGASDLVFVHDTLGAVCIFAFISAKLHGKPVLILQHLGEARFSSRLVQCVFRIAEHIFSRPMLAKADQVVYISERTAQHFSNVKLKRPAKVSFTGVDTSVFRPCHDSAERDRLRANFGLSGDRPTVLYVGRFVGTKGLDILRETARLRPDLQFALAGWGSLDPDGWGLSNVKTFRGLSGESLSELYRSAELFLLASHSESFSLVVREALACGLPVICSGDVAATDVELAPYVTTVSIDPENVGSTAAAIAAKIDPALNSTNGLAGIVFVRRRYNWKSIAAVFSSLLENLVSQQEDRGQVRTPIRIAD